jgi:hypothetical protein
MAQWQDGRPWIRTEYPSGLGVCRRAEQDDFAMRVPDKFLQAVVFIGCRLDGKAYKGATAFFVGSDDGGAVVTARHVIDQIRHKSDDRRVLIWLNKLDGRVDVLESPVKDWVFHPDDPTADSAVLPHMPSLAQYDHVSVMADAILTDEIVQRRGVGIGDDIWVPGLFAPHSGTERNEPILRAGHLAGLPSEPVLTDLGPMTAYLAELRSIGGLSGSPVLVEFGLWRVVYEEDDPEPLGESPNFMLLGLVHGHYDVKAPLQQLGGGGLMKPEAINMGIGIVVPGQKIVETLAEAMARKHEEVPKTTMATPDATGWKRAEGDYSRADFIADLSQVTKPELHERSD